MEVRKLLNKKVVINYMTTFFMTSDIGVLRFSNGGTSNDFILVFYGTIKL